MVDAALGAAVALVVAIAIASDLGGERGPDALAYLFAAGLGALMLVRRSYPILALIATSVGLLAYYAADYPPVGLAMPIAAALYSAAEQGRLRAAVVVAAALLAVSSFFRIAEGQDLAYLLGYELASTVGVLAAAIALGAGVRSRRLWREEQRRREELVAAEREREAASRVERERLTLARDLHDVLAHMVTVVSMQADVAREALDDQDAAAASAALGTIRSVSGDAARELRTTVSVLRRPADETLLVPTGSMDQLDRLVRSSGDSGLPVDLRVEGETRTLPLVVDTTAYRIIQESLTNALRHAGAASVAVVVSYHPDRLDLRVVDDGVGVPDGTGMATNAGLSTGSGLAGMRERAALLGGTVRAGNAAGGGFEMFASLPLDVSGRQEP